MKKIMLFIFIFWGLNVCMSAHAKEIEINTSVIATNPEREYFIISAGEKRGVEIGDGLIVHREGKKIAEGYIIEVRPSVSAAEILRLAEGEEIQKGDSVLIVKRKEPFKSTSPYSFVSGQEAENAETIQINIHSRPDTVFAYANLILRENGYSIISADRTAGILMATKPLELSLLKELWADAVAAIDHKIVVTLDIKSQGDISSLSVKSFEEHFQKDKHVKRGLTQGSKYYEELMALISDIKKRSEY